jgi:tetratricopeptide (TPR) repeat protein
MTDQMAGTGRAGGESILGPVPLDVPTKARQHFEQAGAYEARDDLESALRECDLAIQIAPAWAEVHNLRGIVLDAMGQKEEALEAYREALRLDPVFEEAQENLSEAEAEAELGREQGKDKPAISKQAVYRPGCVLVAAFLIAFFAVVGGVWPGVRLIGELGQPGRFADRGLATFVAYSQLGLGVLLLVAAVGIWAMKKWGTAIYVVFVAFFLSAFLLAIFGSLPGEGLVIYDMGQFAVSVGLLVTFVAIAVGLVNLWRKGELS